MIEKTIAVVPGDGIGVDVTREAVKALRALEDVAGVTLRLTEYDYGADRYLATGVSLPPGGLEEFAHHDAIFMGAFGDPRVPDMKHAADILLGTRFGLDLFANVRPVKLLDERLCPLKERTLEDVDFVVLRENTEGLYVGMGGQFKKDTPDEIAVQEDINTRKGVERVIRYAYELARKGKRRKVLMSDKANVLTYGHDLWQRVFKLVSSEFPEMESSHMYVDALSMQMVKNPGQFEVIVTCNMFGDIVTDIGAQLQGGLGMAASGNINPEGAAMFEPVHGSAPKYAGKNTANPMGAILTTQMMVEHLGLTDAARMLEESVVSCLRKRQCTRDLGGELGTAETGDAVCEELKKLA